jgi:carboxyl-terminal processing protease
MNTKLTSPITTLFFTFFAFVAGYTLGQSPSNPLSILGGGSTAPAGLDDTFTPFWEVWELVHIRYFDQPVDDIALAEGAIDGMLAVLGDPNTRYLSPEDQAVTQENMDGEIQGIGAEVSEDEGAIVIVSPIEGSPAEAAGLQPGDILRTADGVELTGMSVVEAAALVRGPKGTMVVLGIERDGELFEVEIERDIIRVPSVRGEMLEDGLAYVRLTQFGTQTDEELEELLNTLMAQNPQGMILDMRRNPGGSLDTAVNIADQFLGDGRILLERFGDGRETEFESTDKGLAEDIPLVVLIDEGSASASEVLAGAIQDRGRGTLIGQLSFGKGTVQTWQELSNGGGVRITTARWLTPDENWVHGQGLTPDYFIPLTESEEDEQLEAAVDFLLGKEIISVPPEGDKEE